MIIHVLHRPCQLGFPGRGAFRRGRRVGRSRPTAGLPADDVLAEQMALGRPHDRAQRAGLRRRPAQCRERRAERLLALSDGPTTRCQCRRGRCACRRRSDLRQPRPAGCAPLRDRDPPRLLLLDRRPCRLGGDAVLPGGTGLSGKTRRRRSPGDWSCSRRRSWRGTVSALNKRAALLESDTRIPYVDNQRWPPPERPAPPSLLACARRTAISSLIWI
jgi:hypothetical protein